MTEFNLDSLPKRMPYRMPEGTLEQIERNVMLRLDNEKADGRRPDVAASPTAATPGGARTISLRWRRWTEWAVSAAAAVAAVCVLGLRPTSVATSTEADVEAAFANLCDDDQDFLIALYQDDPFMDN